MANPGERPFGRVRWDGPATAGVIPPPKGGCLRAEVAVIGSGPGGAVTACTLAEAGRDVLQIEEGSYFPPETPPAFSLQEMVAKYRNGGLTAALGPATVAYVEGRCVGGGSEINGGLYHRTPPEVLAHWRREFRVDSLSESDLEPHFEACERELSVSLMPGPAPMASLRLHEGAQQLGWRSLEVPRLCLYRTPDGPDHPARAVRQTMSRTYIPRALGAGGRLLCDTRVVSLRRSGSIWALRCVAAPGGGVRWPIKVEARTVFVAGGAIQTPALLLRSGVTRNIGNSLRMHPTVKVIARFNEPVNSSGVGIPVHQVKQFAPRISFGCSISSPGYLALGLSDYPDRLAEITRGWTRMAVYYVMVSGSGSGWLRVISGFDEPLVRYRITGEDLADLSTGLRELCRLLLRARAVELFPDIMGVTAIRTESDLRGIPSPLPASQAKLMTVHLFSSCPMGEDTRRCAVDSFGQVHRTNGLFVADASLLCTQPSVNPQGTIMALCRRNALKFLGQL
jgi:choline dehydrogenase-like flavoprotein